MTNEFDVIVLVTSSLAILLSSLAIAFPRVKVVRINDGTALGITPDKHVNNPKDPAWRKFYKAKMKESGITR